MSDTTLGDPEQEALRDTLRRFLSAEAPTTKVRDWMETEAGFDASLWRSLSVDLGLAAGNDDARFPTTALVAEELGRALTSGPVLLDHRASAEPPRGCSRE